ncbi:MAG TPA: YgaP-like transmembrane domain [Chthoniobacteraceae bacterium]|jgi:hypothetical protein|nr:hypothetical protein [Chthoniobacter sp.]HEV7869216.1 YgaP-like transmembrane domain [Chthoniobacteraceae bacterium]
MKFFTPNIAVRGRLVRAIGGFVFLVGALLIFPHSRVAAVAFCFAAGFMLFEAARGWCVARACGIKTPF